MARTSPGDTYYPGVYPGINFYFNDFIQGNHIIPKFLSIPSGLFDIPATFVVDTVCLPVDIINMVNRQAQENKLP